MRWHSTVIDAADPARLGRWWGEVLGLPISDERPGLLVLPGLSFEKAISAKAGRNRLRLELRCDELAADVEKLVNMGARHVDIGQGSGTGTDGCVVLADPEGNEFCVLADPRVPL